MKRVAIIGGGMAGLAAAHTLNRAMSEEGVAIDWHLYEQQDRVGGKIVTDAQDGFVIEGGPDSFITQKPDGLALCKELGLDQELIPCNQDQQKVYILVNGQLCALPMGFRLTVPTRIWPFLRSPLFSWRAKLRMSMEPFIPARQDDEDESVSAFITRRLGREAADKIGGPLMAGIYVADPERLSILSTFPMFRAMERQYDSLMRAMRVAARKPSAKTPMFMSLKNGMGQLVERLHAPLAARCHTGVRVESIETQAEAPYALHTDDGIKWADALILAAPLPETARLLADLDATAAEELAGIRYVSTATLSLGYALPLNGVTQPLDGFGFVIPRSEQRSILACTWSSVKFDHRAPDGHVLMRVFIGGDGQESLLEQSDDDLVTLARRELHDILGLTNDPVLHRVYRWPRGNPQYDVGHAARMRALCARVHARSGLQLAGSGIQGIGLPDCIKSGRSAAESILGFVAHA